MRYNKIFSFNISDGPYIGVSLYTQGCPAMCRGCFNPETWDGNGGKEFTQKEIDEICGLLNKEYMRRLSILGGEPLLPRNYSMLRSLIEQAMTMKNGDLWVWIWTGRKFEDVMEEAKSDWLLRDILYHTDYIVDGPFILEQKDLTLAFRGSRNQRIIDVQSSLERNKVIVADFDNRMEETIG